MQCLKCYTQLNYFANKCVKCSFLCCEPKCRESQSNDGFCSVHTQIRIRQKKENLNSKNNIQDTKEYFELREKDIIDFFEFLKMKIF